MDPGAVTPWSVMTWNVHGSDRPEIDALAEAIRIESPDVVVFQEIREHQAQRLAEALPMRYSWALKHAPYTRLVPSRSEGMAIMTPHSLGAPGHTEISQDQPMRSWRRRLAQWALVGRPDRSLAMVLNLHLSPHDAELRRSEALRVSEIATAIGDEQAMIVAGDLNDADDPTVIAALPGVEHLVPSPTNPAERPTQRLDHVLLPADATDVSVTVPGGGAGWAAISDHLPVTVRFTMPPRFGPAG